MESDANVSLIIYNAPGKLLGLALGSLAFVVVGVLMMTIPPPSGWSPALAGVVGAISILFGASGLVIAIQAARQPVVLLYPDELFAVQHRLTISYIDVLEVN